MPNSYNRWSKLAGLPQESEGLLSESVDHQNDETEVRNIVREQIQTMLSEGLLTEARASREQGRAIQNVLNNIMVGEEGFPIEADGLYGPKTRDAVVAFQEEFDIKPVDGIVGPVTLDKMYKKMVEKVNTPGSSTTKLDMKLMSDLPLSGEGVVFGYKLADSPSRAPAPEPAEEEKMSNEQFISLMDKLYPGSLSDSQKAQLRGGEKLADAGIEKLRQAHGDLEPGERDRLEVTPKGQLDLEMDRLVGSEFDIVDLDEDIFEEA
tara:strand:- start:617 stop:1408 length:792 start_codon:yes stop_codon:yes gene_type:complete